MEMITKHFRNIAVVPLADDLKVAFAIIDEAEARATASLRAENERLREALKPFAGAAYFFDADGNDFERDYEDDFTLGDPDEDDVLNSLTVGHLRQAASVLSISPAAGRTDQEGQAMGQEGQGDE
ncbi:MAG: hypothetical protein ABF665_09210 [Gluconacetobacter sp.]